MIGMTVVSTPIFKASILGMFVTFALAIATASHFRGKQQHQAVTTGTKTIDPAPPIASYPKEVPKAAEAFGQEKSSSAKTTAKKARKKRKQPRQ